MMKRGVKILLSLIIAVVISSLFTLFAFIKAFSLIETGIYLPNLKAAAEREVLDYGDSISLFIDKTMQYFRGQVNSEALRLSYSNRILSASDINLRNNSINEMFSSYPKMKSIRLTDQLGDKIHFSSQQSDILSQSPTQIMYSTLAKSDPVLFGLSSRTGGGGQDKILWDDAGQRLIFRLRIADSGGQTEGFGFVSLEAGVLEQTLFDEAGLIYRDVRVIDDKGLLIDVTGNAPYDNEVFLQTVNKAFSRTSADTLSSDVLSLGKSHERYLLYAVRLKNQGNIAVLFPMQRFAMGSIDKIIVLVVFYITVFLLVFFIGNVRQDPIRIVTQRMHQFQVEFLREFFEKRDQINVARWRKEIDARRDEIKRYMKRGIKKLSETKETEIDSYIIDGWNEVISIIKSKIQKPPESDMSRIETLLRRVLEEQHVIIARGQKPFPAQENSSEEIRMVPKTATTVENDTEVEEVELLESAEPENVPHVPSASISADDLEEIEAVEEIEPLDAADDVEEADLVEDLEELAELEEASEPGTATVGHPVEKTADAEKDEKSMEEDVETLAVVPEIKELPPLPFETLEELQTVSQDDAVVSDDAGEAEDFRNCITDGKIKVFPVSKMIALLEGEHTNIVMKDGVFRIKEELFKNVRQGKKNKGLRALAQSLLETGTGGAISSIDELYPGDDLLEETERKKIQERQYQARKSQNAVKTLLLTPRGLDLDSYMKAFSFQITDKVMIYAIGELIKKAKAVSAVLFTDENGFKVNLAIGLTNRSANLFNFRTGGFFYEQYLKNMKIIVCEGVCQQIKIFAKHLAGDDLKFIRSCIFIPAILEKRNAYLFMGFTTPSSLLDKNNLFIKMDISPVH